MHSSISSSDSGIVREEDVPSVLPYGLRLTAADRPGMAQPVPERDVPHQPWRAISATVLVLVVLLSFLWERQMRRLELVPGDIGEDLNAWPELRRQVDVQAAPVAIMGDSRILLGTDLNRVKQLTGVRPVQLGLTGTSGLPILEDLAADPHFKGLAIVGVADLVYFGKPFGTKAKDVIELKEHKSPSKRASFLIYRQLCRYLVMLDPNYQLSVLVARLDPGFRPGVHGPDEDVWKIDEMFDGGQAWLWERLEHDTRLSDHARMVWHKVLNANMLEKGAIPKTLKRSKAAVDKIRARGGDVIFVRPPSARRLRALEDAALPKAKGWDALLAYAHVNGLHTDDLPITQGLILPEESHVSRACATVFTDAYIRRLTEMTPFLRMRADAPAPLSAKDCAVPVGRSLEVKNLH
jgi:hypothetical protein